MYANVQQQTNWQCKSTLDSCQTTCSAKKTHHAENGYPLSVVIQPQLLQQGQSEVTVPPKRELLRINPTSRMPGLRFAGTRRDPWRKLFRPKEITIPPISPTSLRMTLAPFKCSWASGMPSHSYPRVPRVRNVTSTKRSSGSAKETPSRR